MTALIIVKMIAIVVTITAISVCGFFLALLSYFLDFCFYRGNIFGFWLPFIAKRIVRAKFPAKYQEIARSGFSDEKKASMYMDVAEDDNTPLYKMLGGCVVCLNVWIGLLTFPVIAIGLNISLWYYPVYVLSGSFFLRKISNID